MKRRERKKKKRKTFLQEQQLILLLQTFLYNKMTGCVEQLQTTVTYLLQTKPYDTILSSPLFSTLVLPRLGILFLILFIPLLLPLSFTSLYFIIFIIVIINDYCL